ncbi:MAG: YhcH/YjgK/YiaL family protein [Acidobacteria bacterium]|nr:YhcH/YjgK/YiaL family protein [Acidobacteriota bacterium]
MILDTLTNAERLQKLHPGLGAAFQFLRGTNLRELPEGRREIESPRLYALVVRGPGRGQKGTKLEAHRRYIDVQYSLIGHDVIGWKQLATCQNPVDAYDEVKDIQFFVDAPDSWVTIPQGSFGIFYPEDAHAPMAAESPIYKVVVKVLVDWQ